MSLFHRESGCFSKCCFCIVPWGRLDYPFDPLRAFAQFSTTLWSSKTYVSGFVFQVLVLKVGVSDVVYKPFIPQREALVLWVSFRLWVIVCGGGEGYQDCDSAFPTHFRVVSLSFAWCKEVVLRVCACVYVSLEELALYVAVDLVFMGGGKFRIFLCCHLPNVAKPDPRGYSNRPKTRSTNMEPTRWFSTSKLQTEKKGLQKVESATSFM